MVRLYIIGITILIVAILANALITKLGILSWYEFLSKLNEKGVNYLQEVSILDYLWLFIAYPLVLSFGYWLGDKIHSVF